jgi:DNA-binding PadR family transcriptional regulator
MPQRKTPPRSSLGLIVLLLVSSEPMHVYRMQKLIEAQGKDRVVNVRSRANLYQAIERLVRLGLAEVQATVRQDGYPDRTVYGVTEAGREVARDWLREMLRSTEGEYPEFIAAVSVLFALAPDDARTQLEQRAERLASALAEAEHAVQAAPAGLPRLFLLEEEYRQAILQAELSWVSGVVDDLRAGRLDWSEEWLRAAAAAFLPSDDEHTKENE